MAMAMLEVNDIKVYYGMIQAIKGVSFHVDEGEVIALIGANGAGNTAEEARLARLLPRRWLERTGNGAPR